MEAQDAVRATLVRQVSGLRVENQNGARPQTETASQTQTDGRDPDCPQDPGCPQVEQTDVEVPDCPQNQQVDTRDQTGVVEARWRSRLVRRVRGAFRSVGGAFRLVGDVVGSVAMKWFRNRRMKSSRRAVAYSMNTV